MSANVPDGAAAPAPVRWGVCGTGRMAATIAEELLNLGTAGAELHAVGSRREQRAMASIAAQRQAQPNAEPILDWATLRMNRFFYRFGFACLGLALIVSWISTRF